MKITLRNKLSFIDRTNQIVICRLFNSALDSLESVVRRITVTCIDENGPKGGVDKCCKAHITLKSGDDLVLSSKSSNIIEAVKQTAEMARHSVSRLQDKRKRARRRSKKLSLQTV